VKAIWDKIHELEERIAELEGEKQKQKEKRRDTKERQAMAREVWRAYEEAFESRYATKPIRNAKINRQVSELVKRLGQTLACDVVRFYLSQNDRFFVERVHELGQCLAQAESLAARFQAKISVSKTKATKLEKTGQSAQAMQNYLEKKHGGQK